MFARNIKQSQFMKLITVKITAIAFLAFGLFSCNNNKTKSAEPIEAAAEASETATSYQVDPSVSTIKWEGKKPTATHFGKVSLSSGTLMANNEVVEAGNFTIDMTSITVEDLEGDNRAYLEAHLKGQLEGKEGDFFDSKKYPTATFELTGIEGNIVKGNLTIKDQTNPVEFPATITVTDDQLVIESEQFDLNRTDWGINFMSRSIFTDLGDKFVNDTMKIAVYIVAKNA
jgi:polyisoprenoid-binding protein YceI